MHLLVPFAAGQSTGARQALATMGWPRLQSLLREFEVVAQDESGADELSLDMPHERALALALGWSVQAGPAEDGDQAAGRTSAPAAAQPASAGHLPWAARLAQADGVDVGAAPWGLMTPGHWHLGTEQVSLVDPESLVLDAEGSRQALQAVSELFTSEGCRVAWGAPLRWYVSHPALAALPTASLDRVIGRNVNAWLQPHPAARLMRRLQNEVQMLLHEHPFNTEREARGLPTLNSFWLSGCGVARAERGPAPQVDERLRRPALSEDWAAWAKAWESLEEGPLQALHDAARRGESGLRLTLAGECRWVTLAPPGATGVRRVASRALALLRRPDPRVLLESL